MSDNCSKNDDEHNEKVTLRKKVNLRLIRLQDYKDNICKDPKYKISKHRFYMTKQF